MNRNMYRLNAGKLLDLIPVNLFLVPKIENYADAKGRNKSLHPIVSDTKWHCRAILYTKPRFTDLESDPVIG